jgi:dTDP-4-amino-4,6-dideoxygalactose transaminase
MISMKKIDFNKPYITGKEIGYIQEAINKNHISGNGSFTKRSQDFFKKRFSFQHCLLTTSCTDALEMASILCNIQPGDEIILPSYTFVSTANPFVLRGAKIVFADSYHDNPNMDVSMLECLITKKTKAIVPVHYAGVACDMGMIMDIAKKYNLFVIEDAAQAIDSYYKGKALGGIGHLGAFSFHETKNIVSGEGGALVINEKEFMRRAEIIWEKGTNRASFYRGEVDKYGWVDVGSSFLPSEILAAFLFAQLESLEEIQTKRIALWKHYYDSLASLRDKGYFDLPFIPDYATNNGHLFYLVCKTEKERGALIDWLKGKGIHSVFHYLALHRSPFYGKLHDGRSIPNSERFSDCLVRLPMYYELSPQDVEFITDTITEFYKRGVNSL